MSDQNKLTIEQVQDLIDNPYALVTPKDVTSIAERLLEKMRENERFRYALTEICRDSDSREPDSSYMGMIAKDAVQSNKHSGIAPDDSFHPPDAGHEKIGYHILIEELKDRIKRFENWASHYEWCNVAMGDCDCGLAELVQPKTSVVSRKDEAIAENCKHWKDGMCYMCGVQHQYNAVGASFHCPYFTQRN